MKRIKIYKNPHHLNNCCIDFDIDITNQIIETDIFYKLSDRENSMLQAIFANKN